MFCPRAGILASAYKWSRETQGKQNLLVHSRPQPPMPPKRKAASAAKPVKKAKPEKKTVPKAQPQEEDDSSVGSGRDGDLNLIVEHW